MRDTAEPHVSCFDELSIVDTETRLVRSALSDQARSNGIAVTLDGRHVYIANCWQNTVPVLDTGTHGAVERVRVGTTPWNIAFSPNGARAYVTNANEDTVSVIDTAKHVVTQTIRLSHVPTGISATDNAVWASGNGSATVTAIDTAAHRVAATVEVGLSAQPAGIAVVQVCGRWPGVGRKAPGHRRAPAGRGHRESPAR